MGLGFILGLFSKSGTFGLYSGTKSLGRVDSRLILTLYTLSIYPSVHNQLCERFSRDGL